MFTIHVRLDKRTFLYKKKSFKNYMQIKQMNEQSREYKVYMIKKEHEKWSAKDAF